MEQKLIAESSISINTGIETVWHALTDAELIKKYFFNTNARSDWKVGSPITFTGEWEGKTYTDKGTITAVKRPGLLSYTYWSSMSGKEDIPENYINVIYKLSENNGVTILTISNDKIKTADEKQHVQQNWQKVLDGLKKVLENK